MKNLVYLLFCLTFLLSGCNSEADVQLPKNSNALDETMVPVSDALKRAEQMLAKIEGNQTRSHARTVNSIKYINPTTTTRNGAEDSLYYLVNYDNNEGFAVLGAKKNLEGVYAISGEGHLEMEDTILNPGLSIFFDMLPKTADTQGLEGGGPSIKDDSIQQTIITLRTIDLSTKLDPTLSLEVRSWHQGEPYNAKCKPYVVGCAPLAVAMIMSYYEWPLSYNGVNFDWSLIKNTASIESEILASKLPDLLRAIGAGNNLDTNYGKEESSSNLKSHYKRTFEHFGYKKPGDFKNYTLYDLSYFFMLNKKPVLVIGKKADSGHAWVIDGYYCDWFKEEGNLESSYYGEGYMFHFVWGWNGVNNGYFKIGNSITPMYRFNGPGDVTSMSETDLAKIQYYNLEFVGDFEPNK